MKVTILSVLFFLLCYTDGISCDCGRGTISVKDFNSNDWIFIGTLLSEKRSDDYHQRKCTYKIVKAYRGVKQGDTIQITDASGIGACGLGNLTMGADYLIYARGNAEKWTSSCQGDSRVPIYILPRDSTVIYDLKGRYRRPMDDTINTTFHTDTLFLSALVPKAQKNTMQKFYGWDGKISAKGRYENGLPDGLWRYYEDGKLVEYGKYFNGKKDSLWVKQYGTSKDIEEYKSGEFTESLTSFHNGKLYSRTGPVGDGKKWIKVVYHDNGRPRFIAYASPPQRGKYGRLHHSVSDSLFRGFNKADKVLEQGIYKNGLSTGHWTYYYEDGRLRMEGDYIEGKKTGIWKIYYPNKKVKATGTYEQDEKTGVWKYYNKNGMEITPNPELINEDEDSFTYSGEKR